MRVGALQIPLHALHIYIILDKLSLVSYSLMTFKNQYQYLHNLQPSIILNLLYLSYSYVFAVRNFAVVIC